MDHVVPKKTYYLTGISLMVLLALTFGASFLQLGVFSVMVALLIAVTKAMLVILFFMHVKYSSRLTWVFVGAGFVWLAIMFMLTLGDYIARWF